jgi:hypothetical protein
VKVTKERAETLRWFAEDPAHRCTPDQAKLRSGLKPTRPRCVFCRRVIRWGELYRGRKQWRAKGLGLHEKCAAPAIKEAGKFRETPARRLANISAAIQAARVALSRAEAEIAAFRNGANS